MWGDVLRNTSASTALTDTKSILEIKMSLSMERLQEALERSDELVNDLAGALERILNEGCLDPRLLCVLQANQILAEIELLKG